MVYVDQLKACVPNKKWKYKEACHLFADDPHELHKFAKEIGLSRSWFQDHPRLKHYDLTQGMRWRALKAGARSCGREVVAEHMRKNDEQRKKAQRSSA